MLEDNIIKQNGLHNYQGSSSHAPPMSLISVTWTLFRSSGMWNRFDLDCILGKGDQLFQFIWKIDPTRVPDPDNDKNSIKIEWVIQKTSLNQNHSKPTDLNISIVQHLHHSKNELLGSQMYTSKATLEHRPNHKRWETCTGN